MEKYYQQEKRKNENAFNILILCFLALARLLSRFKTRPLASHLQAKQVSVHIVTDHSVVRSSDSQVKLTAVFRRTKDPVHELLEKQLI
ncbi:hypothetical protein D5R40_30820 [Okeania hirsuta]|uniref:Uncharacterized protein n=1 Tax=Okeania hirsuta TaxID=1458930 RepID=A0A3N6NWN1_9CYAN|nr:hypothetical protein D5R40_30820 [Okeania hirsuta]